MGRDQGVTLSGGMAGGRLTESPLRNGIGGRAADGVAQVA